MPTLEFIVSMATDSAQKALGGFVEGVNKGVANVNFYAENGRKGIANFEKAFGTITDTAGMAFGIMEKGWNAVIVPAMESQQIMAQTENVIRSTGGAAGMTADEIERLAGAMSRATGADDELIQSGENMLLTFTNIGQSVFPEATSTLLDMAVAMNKGSVEGLNLQGSAIQLGKALNDPIAGVSALAEVGVTFTQSQKDAIKSMVEMGDVAGAQKVILQELKREFGGAATAAGDTAAGKFSKFSNTIGNFVEDAGSKLLVWLEAAAETIDVTVNGTQQLEDAFHATQQQMMADVSAGRMSIDDYNAGIQGMTDSIYQWHMAVATQLHDQAMASQSFYEITGAINTKALVEQNAANIAATAAEADRVRAQALNDLKVAAMQGKDALALELEAEQAQVAATEASVAAMKAREVAAGDMITKNASLAQSYKDVTDVEAKQMLAKSGIDAINAALQNKTLSEQDAAKATEALMLKYDLATPKSLAMASAQKDLDNALIDGYISTDRYIVLLGNIPKAANDGKVTLDELMSMGVKPTTAAVRDQDKAVNTMKNSWAQIPRDVKTVYTVEIKGEIPNPPGGGGPTKANGKAGGGLVSEGWWYLHDDEVVLNRSQREGRESVPAEWVPGFSRSGGRGVSVSAVNVYGAPGMDVQELARAVKVELGRATNEATNAGMGYTGDL